MKRPGRAVDAMTARAGPVGYLRWVAVADISGCHGKIIEFKARIGDEAGGGGGQMHERGQAQQGHGTQGNIFHEDRGMRGGTGREGLVMRKSGGKVKPPDRIPATVSDTISRRIVHSGSYFAG